MIRWVLVGMISLMSLQCMAQEISFKGDTLYFNQTAQFILKQNHLTNPRDSSIYELNFQIRNFQNTLLLKFKEVLLSKEDRYIDMEIIPNKKRYSIYKNTSLESVLKEICKFQLVKNQQLIPNNVLNFVLAYGCEMPLFQEKIVQYLPDKGAPIQSPEVKLFPKSEILQKVKISELGIITYQDSIIGSVIATSGCSYSSFLQTFIVFDLNDNVIARSEFFNDEQQDAVILTLADKRKYYTQHPKNEQSFLQVCIAVLIQLKYIAL
jgi:hypothetical protein